MSANPSNPRHEWLAELAVLDELPLSPLPETARTLAEIDPSDLSKLKEADLAFWKDARAERPLQALRRQARATAPRRSRSAHWGVGFALAAAACVALALIPHLDSRPGRDVLRAKGLQPYLTAYRKTADGSVALADGATVRAGDVIQLGYVAAGRHFGAIVSIDAAGHVTLHLPEDKAGNPYLAPEGERLLPYAYRLDATPGAEDFIFVTAEKPFAVDALVHDVEHWAKDRSVPMDHVLPGQARTLRLNKERP